MDGSLHKAMNNRITNIQLYHNEQTLALRRTSTTRSKRSSRSASSALVCVTATRWCRGATRRVWRCCNGSWTWTSSSPATPTSLRRLNMRTSSTSTPAQPLAPTTPSTGGHWLAVNQPVNQPVNQQFNIQPIKQ